MFSSLSFCLLVLLNMIAILARLNPKYQLFSRLLASGSIECKISKLFRRSSVIVPMWKGVSSHSCKYALKLSYSMAVCIFLNICLLIYVNNLQVSLFVCGPCLDLTVVPTFYRDVRTFIMVPSILTRGHHDVRCILDYTVTALYLHFIPGVLFWDLISLVGGEVITSSNIGLTTINTYIT